MFWMDLLLNFFQGFKSPETFKMVRRPRKIAYNYVCKGWFIIDLITVFPFGMLFPSDGAAQSKWFVLLGAPRIMKVIDIFRFNKLLKVLLSKGSHTTQYNVFYAYRMYRDIIISCIYAIIITFFIDFILWLSCGYANRNTEDPYDTFVHLITCPIHHIGCCHFYPFTHLEKIHLLIMFGILTFLPSIYERIMEKMIKSSGHKDYAKKR